MNRGLLAENERDAWIFLNQIPDLGPVQFHRLLIAAKSARDILKMRASDLQVAEVPRGMADSWHQMFQDPARLRSLEGDLNRIAKGECQVVTELDGAYPAQLRELFDRPPVLYYKGRWPQPGTVLIGLVGTRHPRIMGGPSLKNWRRICTFKG